LPTAKRPRGRPTREEALQRHEHLLRVATKIFLDQGYAATSMESIADAAGTWKQGIYLKYETKKALFLAVVDQRTLPDLFEGYADDSHLPIETGLLNRIQTLLNHLLDPYNRKLMRLVQREGQVFPELGDRMMRMSTESISTPLERYVADQIARGVFRKMDVAVTVMTLLDLAFGKLTRFYFYHDYDVPPEGEVNDWAQEITDLLLNGLRA